MIKAAVPDIGATRGRNRRGKGTVDEKFAALEAAGVKTVQNLAEIGDAVAEITSRG